MCVAFEPICSGSEPTSVEPEQIKVALHFRLLTTKNFKITKQ